MARLKRIKFPGVYYCVAETENTQYHLQAMQCVGVRARSGGVWNETHHLLDAEFRGSVAGKDREVMVPYPVIGATLWFHADGKHFLSSPIIMVRPPDKSEEQHTMEIQRRTKIRHQSMSEVPAAMLVETEMPEEAAPAKSEREKTKARRNTAQMSQESFLSAIRVAHGQSGPEKATAKAGAVEAQPKSSATAAKTATPPSAESELPDLPDFD